MRKLFLPAVLLLLTGCATTSTLYYHPAQEAVPTVPARLAVTQPGFSHTAAVEVADGTGYNHGRKEVWDPPPSFYYPGNRVDSLELDDRMRRLSVHYHLGYRGRWWFAQAGAIATQGTYTTQYFDARQRYAVSGLQVPLLLGAASTRPDGVNFHIALGALFRHEWGGYTGFQQAFARSPRDFYKVVTTTNQYPWSPLAAAGLHIKADEAQDFQASLWYVRFGGTGVQLSYRYRWWFVSGSGFLVNSTVESGTPAAATIGGGVVLPSRSRAKGRP